MEMTMLNFPDKVLLDGGMGRELRFRGVETIDTIWSANGLLVAPEIVRQIHLDFIAAGADIITTNTYGIIRANLAKEGLEDRFVDLNRLACTLAAEARKSAERSVMIAALSDLPVTGFLVNCCAPESITMAMPQLAKTGANYMGGYANTFQPIPEDWTIDGQKETDGALDIRSDLDPESYAGHVADWLSVGATVVGGCCGTRPAHIARLRELLDETGKLK
jgi:S-methylmethionine-dependent homocysteine/selenocysteine methylase